MEFDRFRKLRLEPLEDRRLLAATPTGSQFDVPWFQTDKTQFVPDVAMIDDGRYVVVWEHHYAANDIDVRYRRYDRNNMPYGPFDTAVSQVATYNEVKPKVAVAPNGNFVVVWEHNEVGGSTRDVWFALYTWEGLELRRGRVNTTTALEQTAPDVDMASDGSFVVVWRDDIGINADIRFRSYNAQGLPHQSVDQEVLSGGSSWDNEDRPTVAMLSSTRFVAAWEETDVEGQTSNRNTEVAWAVYTYNFSNSRFDWLSNSSFGTQGSVYRRPSIAPLDDGFLLAFEGDIADSVARFDAYYGVFNSDGTTRQLPQRISGLEGVPGQGALYYGSGVGSVSVDSSDDGGYVVAWHGPYPAAGGDNDDVYYREYNAFGDNVTAGANAYSTRWGRVNTRTTERQRDPRVAKSNGSFVVVYDDYLTSANIDVVARPYSVPDDYGNDAASATLAAPNSILMGRIDYEDDRDAFRFAAVQGAQYTFMATPQTPGASLTLAVIGVTGDIDNDLLEYDFGTLEAPAWITWTAPTAATYYFGVQSSDVANYELRFSRVLAGDFSGDGVVDGTDFLRWQRGESPRPLGAADLTAWKANFGAPASSSGATASALVATAPVAAVDSLAGSNDAKAAFDAWPFTRLAPLATERVDSNRPGSRVVNRAAATTSQGTLRNNAVDALQSIDLLAAFRPRMADIPTNATPESHEAAPGEDRLAPIDEAFSRLAL